MDQLHVFLSRLANGPNHNVIRFTAQNARAIEILYSVVSQNF